MASASSPMPAAAQAVNMMPPIGPMQPMPGTPSGSGPGGAPFSPSMLPGVMQAMQNAKQALQQLAQGLPPLSPFIAQFLSQLGQAVPNVIMSASGQAPSPGGPPSIGGPSAPGGGPQGMSAGAPPMPPTGQ